MSSQFISEFLTKLVYSVLFHLLAAKKIVGYFFVLKNKPLKTPSHYQIPLDSFNGSDAAIVCDIDGCLLNTQSFFPFFMLVAFEGGSPVRGLLLLLTWPFLCLLNYRSQLRVMIFVTFCGLKTRHVEAVCRAILPKFYVENLNPKACNIMKRFDKRIVITSVPKLMVEKFLLNYLQVDEVIGTELHSYGSFLTGFVSEPGLLVKHRALKARFADDSKPYLGLGNALRKDHFFFLSLCKEAYVMTQEDLKNTAKIECAKPTVFHDGRLAFLPTPAASTAMFLWIPVGIALALLRISVGVMLPYKTAMFMGKVSGIKIIVNGQTAPAPGSGVLYVCNHRTLLDPVFLSTSIGRPLSAVTYSLSRVSEIISPIKTVRLTRERTADAATMRMLLQEGDLVVCPEGTTCREPYLLRFSPLFAEVAEDIVPVAINTKVTMFYGTTASGAKWLDPICFLMNPSPSYCVHLMDKLPKELTCSGGKTSHEVANYLQRQIADVLGFQCTNLTRRDKYLILAGNNGAVRN